MHADRLLPVKRYSGDDQTGVLERQEEDIQNWVAQHGGQVVHWVTDETVSGSVNLDQRKALGEWLREPKLSQWDTMLVTTQDRITRDDLHWWGFVGRLAEWDKRLIVLDDPTLDLSTPNGRMIAGFKATQAANYRQDVMKKMRNARASFRRYGRWAGGHWPYGYRAIPNPDDEGWKLIPDPETSVLVQEIVSRYIHGDSLTGIARDLNAREVPSARVHQARTRTLRPGEKRKEPRDYRWTESTIRRILRSPSLLGYATHKGELIRNDGIPVQYAEPIIKYGDFTTIQELLDEYQAPRRQTYLTDRSPLLGVLYCKCGQKLYHLTNKGKYFYYRCATHTSAQTDQRCGYTTYWNADLAYRYLEEAFLSEIGDQEILEKTFVPGDNHDDEIDALKETIDHLTGNLGNLPPNSRAATTIINKLANYEAKLADLESKPSSSSTWKYRGTGVTYRQKWEATPDWRERGQWLVRMGIRLKLGGDRHAPEIHCYVPEDLAERAPGALLGDADPQFLRESDRAVHQITE